MFNLNAKPYFSFSSNNKPTAAQHGQATFANNKLKMSIKRYPDNLLDVAGKIWSIFLCEAVVFGVPTITTLSSRIIEFIINIIIIQVHLKIH